MSDRYPGALIRAIPPTVSSTGGSGIFTLSQALQYVGQGTWPRKNYEVVLVFTGTSSWTCPTGVTEVDYLVVAGGGGGTRSTSTPSGIAGGGGGAGGFRTGTGFPVSAGTVYTVTVGAGGSGSPSVPEALPGSNSVFGNVPNQTTSAGGGAAGFIRERPCRHKARRLAGDPWHPAGSRCRGAPKPRSGAIPRRPGEPGRPGNGAPDHSCGARNYRTPREPKGRLADP